MFHHLSVGPKARPVDVFGGLYGNLCFDMESVWWILWAIERWQCFLDIRGTPLQAAQLNLSQVIALQARKAWEVEAEAVASGFGALEQWMLYYRCVSGKGMPRSDGAWSPKMNGWPPHSQTNRHSMCVGGGIWANGHRQLSDTISRLCQMLLACSGSTVMGDAFRHESSDRSSQHCRFRVSIAA